MTPELQVNTILQTHMLITLAVSFHGGAGRKSEHNHHPAGQKEEDPFHYVRFIDKINGNS